MNRCRWPLAYALRWQRSILKRTPCTASIVLAMITHKPLAAKLQYDVVGSSHHCTDHFHSKVLPLCTPGKMTERGPRVRKSWPGCISRSGSATCTIPSRQVDYHIRIIDTLYRRPKQSLSRSVFRSSVLALQSSVRTEICDRRPRIFKSKPATCICTAQRSTAVCRPSQRRAAGVRPRSDCSRRPPASVQTRLRGPEQV